MADVEKDVPHAHPEDEHPRPGMIRRVTKALDDVLRIVFAKWGSFVARRTLLILVLCPLLAALCAIPLGLRFKMESKAQKLWVPQSTDIAKNQKYVNSLFIPDPPETELLFIQEQGNLASKDALRTLAMKVLEMETTDPPLTGSCIPSSDGSAASYCQMRSPLDLFLDVNATIPNDTYGQAALRGLRLVDDREVKRRLEEGPFLTWASVPFQQNQIVGGVSGTGNALRVTALKHTFYLDGDKSWDRVSKDQVDNSNDDGFYVLTATQETDALDDSLSGEIQWFAIGYASLIVYVIAMMGELFHGIRGRMLLGAGALLGEGLAILATFGVASLFGIFYGPVHQALPILLLGLGADDAFVIVRTYDAMARSDPSFLRRSADDRIAITLSTAGSAILITSVTNCFVFLFGAITPIPALSTFSLWAGIGVFWTFFFAVTLFVAFFALDVKRQDARRFDLVPCLKSNSDKDTNLFGLHPGYLSRSLYGWFGKFLMNDFVRPLVLIAFAALFGVMVYGASQLKVQFRFEDFFKKGSSQDQFQVQFDRYFQSQNDFGFYAKDIAYEELEIQNAIETVCNPINGTAVQNNLISEGTVDCWLTSLREFKGGDQSEIIGDKFLPSLKEFLQSADGARFDFDLVCNQSAEAETGSCSATDATGVVSSRFRATFVPLNDSSGEVEGLKAVVALADDSSVPTLFADDDGFIFWELNANILRNTVLLVSISLAVVAIVSLVLIGNPLVASLVLLAIVFSTVLVLGVINFWDVSLNSVSIINLSIAVGLSVDASAHLGRSFLEHAGDRKERVRLALGDIGPAVVHGSISTTLTILFLGFSSSFVFQIFFRCLFTVLLSALGHGLLFLPCMLSYVGPPGHYSNEEERRDAEYEILESRGIVEAGDSEKTVDDMDDEVEA